jgi:Domain of unknown function (DUF4277)
MSNLREIEFQSLDHLGIIVGIIDLIGLVEIINDLIGQEPGEKISLLSCSEGNDIKWIGFCE